MAKKVSVTWVDDLDESLTADETLTFSLDGATYEIDLNEANAQRLRDELAPWIENARRVAAGRRTRRAGAGNQSGQKAAAIREWARANGYEVSARGRISADVRAAYEAAN